MTQPHDEATEPRVDDDLDTVAETRPLPEPEGVDPRRQRAEQMPSIGHIGRYALKYVIGEGGLGTVYAAHDPLLSRVIAIKTLHLDLPQADRTTFNDLFLNEAKAAGSLNHTHIVTVYDAGTSEHGTYIAMELLKGKDLRQLLAMGWKPTPAQAALIVRRVADALSYAHHKGVIHRDIKPANIFMVGRTQPRVLDFGIARIRQAESWGQRDDPQSRFQELVGGSPCYMAPEQVRRQALDRRVDVYALGVVLYELLAHQRAFAGNTLEEIAEAVLHKPVPAPHERNPEVPRALSDIVVRAMQRDPEQRTRSARRLAAELRAWLDAHEQAQARPRPVMPTLLGRTPRTGAPTLGRVLALTGLATMLAAGGTLAWRAHAPEAVPAPVKVQVNAPVTVAVSATPPTAASPSSSPPPSLPPSSASVAENDQAPSVTALPTGVVRLAISPWGEVWVDDRRLGLTPPLNQLALPVGRHQITVRNDGAAEYRQTVLVQAGKPVTVKHQF